MPKNQCPYCDHDNPAESKFCNACGAVLHLAPCPKCGAVNDKSAAQCYRCHHVLSFGGGANMLAPPAAAPAPAAAAAAPASVVINASARYTKKAPIDVFPAEPAEPAASNRPPVIVIVIVLAAFAVASYYAYRQRDAITGHGPAASATEPQSDARGTTGEPAGVAAGNKAVGATSTVPPATTVAAPVAPPVIAEKNNTPAEKTAAANEPARPGVSPATAPARAPEESSRALRRRQQAPLAERKVQPQVPCTEAIAALGLCTPEPTQRRQ